MTACGDCHLSNFGFFATPERNLVFDVNDFDEVPAPFEWDVKRLAASLVVAGDDLGLKRKQVLGRPRRASSSTEPTSIASRRWGTSRRGTPASTSRWRTSSYG